MQLPLLHGKCLSIPSLTQQFQILLWVAVPVATSRSPEEFDAYVKSEVVRWARIIKENQIRLD